MSTHEEERQAIVVSNTGPLISAFQSDSLDLIAALLGPLQVSERCAVEAIENGWEEALLRSGWRIIRHKLTDAEVEQAADLARRIAAHPTSQNREPIHHLGEAEAMVLGQRAEFAGAVLLLDELAARAIALEIGLQISGFAGVLLLAVEEGLLGAAEVKKRLERCQQQGTHYGAHFIRRVYEAAKEVEE